MKNNEPPIRLNNVVNRGQIVQAKYREPEIDDYKGNPLIEALPPILTTDQALKALRYYPDYDETKRLEKSHIRRHIVQNKLRFFEPMEIHFDLERRFSCLIRVGYSERNPMTPGFWNEVSDRVDSISQYGNLSMPRRDYWPVSATGFNIIGMSGVGKSYSIERILSLYPQVIHHSYYRDRAFTHSQITWLKIDCPFDGNIRGLCTTFFDAVDNLLQTNYCKNYGKHRVNQSELLPNMSVVAANQFLGVLVIDEIQRLNLARSGGADLMLNFFVQLVNTIGVPVVLIGTHKALPLFRGEFSQMRRGTGQGDLIWNPMPENEQWKLFVESLWRYQYTRKKTKLTQDPELSKALYEETLGITDLAVKLYMFSQERAIDSGKEEITPIIIRSAAKDKFNLLKPVLDALRMGDKHTLQRFEDVYKAMLEASQPALSVNSDNNDHSSSVQENRNEAISNNEGTTKTHSKFSKSTSSKVGETTPNPSDQENHKKNKPSRRGGGNRTGLIESVRKDPELTAYESIKKAGYIRPASEYLNDD